MVMITCNEKELKLDEPFTGGSLVETLNLREPHQAVAISVNGTLRDFSEPINAGDQVEIYSFEDARGKEVFWHSSAHILAQAVLRIWPDAKPTIGPALKNGFYYDFANLAVSEDDFPIIEKEIEKIVKENYRPVKTIFADKSEALKAFQNNPFKCELINDLPENSSITAYKQGEFFDLCRGPHLSNLSKVKAFKLLKTSAAYWRGDSERESLTRIYGISFPDRKQLKEHLQLLEEAKKRDHRVLGSKLRLFSFFDTAPGMPIIEPAGMAIWNALLDFWRTLHLKEGYEEIKTPIMMDSSLWQLSGHWDNYRENMYISEVDKRTYAIKPMNCPACMLYFKSKRHSYRDLPKKISEIGNVHRHELSGSMTGLLRVRTFHQDDAHIFMRPDQIKDEILGVLQLVDKIYSTFGLKYHLELSTRPEKNTIGTDEEWQMTTEGLTEALEASGRTYKVNEGDGAFYGPKIDMHVEDALGRSWQCGTIQLDMSLPERFELEYTDSDGSPKRPVMIHRALYGSIERFFAILIEHFAGRFPLWLSPRQIRLLPVADRHVLFADEIFRRLQERNFLVETDISHESVSKKIRNAQMDQVNYMLVIGDKECESRKLSLRTRDNHVVGDLEFSDFIESIEIERKTKQLVSPFTKSPSLEFPKREGDADAEKTNS